MQQRMDTVDGSGCQSLFQFARVKGRTELYVALPHVASTGVLAAQVEHDVDDNNGKTN